MISDYCYDIEVYPNVFTCTVTGVVTGDSRCYEISTRKNDLGPFKNFIDRIARRRSRMIGFNNINYDYPVIHYLLTELFDLAASWDFICKKLFEKSKSIIEAPFHSRFKHRISPTKYLVDQIDLSLIHHFDNQAKMTSLKVLEFNMRMTDIEELPFAPETYLTPKQIETLVKYNLHDVRATLDFYKHSLDHIKFREALSVKYGRNFLNHNDTKIGKDYFVMQLEQKIGLTACYTMENGEKKVKQTKRETIALTDIIFPYVSFNTYAFQTVLEWLKDQVITETKGVFTDLTDEQMSKFLHHSPVAKKKKLTKKDRKLSVMLDGIEFVFGTGGIHASINNTRISSTPDKRSKEDIEKIELMKSIDSCITTSNKVLSNIPQHLEKFANEYIRYIRGNPKAAFTRR